MVRQVNPRVAAIVVSFNRCDLLARSLEAISKQTLRPDTLIVVDNRSTDGTIDLLRRWADVSGSPMRRVFIQMHTNTGGAGGFNKGIQVALDMSHDWLWLMDDDVIPSPDALVELLRAADLTGGNNGFYSSLAKHPTLHNIVNVPTIDARPTALGYPNWAEYLANGIIKIHTSTFVSLLLPSQTVLRVGLPIKDFFIWGDDTEYTYRLSKSGIQGYWIGSSEVVHVRPGAQAPNIRYETNSARIKLYKYLYRNRAYLSRTTGHPPLSKYLLKSFIDIISLTLKYRSPKRSMIIVSGLLAGIFFRPTIEYHPRRPSH